jgi:hypothetical protein
MCGFLTVQGFHSATNAVWRLAYWGSTPHSTAQVKLITALPQTTALGLPHGWELVNQVGVVALFAGRSSQWASYFGVPVVLLTMSFRAYAQVLPTVKRIGIIPKSEPATDAKKILAEISPSEPKKVLWYQMWGTCNNYLMKICEIAEMTELRITLYWSRATSRGQPPLSKLNTNNFTVPS